MALLSRLAPYNQGAKTLVVNERVREIMEDQQIPWSNIGELAELAETSEAAREALRRISFGSYGLSPEEIAILKKIPVVARNESCVQILRRVEIGELWTRSATDLEALRELVQSGEYVNFTPWEGKPEVIPVLLDYMETHAARWERINWAMSLIKFANQGHLSREQWGRVVNIPGLYRSLTYCRHMPMKLSPF